MSAVVSRVTKRRSGVLNIFGGSPILGPLAALVLAIIFFATQSRPVPARRSNFSLILQQVMVVGTLAIGQTLVILTGRHRPLQRHDHGAVVGADGRPRRAQPASTPSSRS